MAINLGNVNFGMGADTAGMQKALNQLAAFSRMVDQVSRQQTQGAAAATAAYIRQEHAIQKAIQQTLNLNNAIRRAGANPALIGQNTRSLNLLVNQFARGKVSAVEFQRSIDLFNARLNRNSRVLKDYTAAQRQASRAGSRFNQVVRDLESASVLAVGPLSGLGARIRALSAITTRSTLVIAGFVAGVTGALVGVSMLAAGAVQAQRAFQQQEAVLRAVTGSTTLAGVEFQFALEQSKRLGLQLETTTAQYAQLTATTKGTILQGDQTREIFLGIAEAAAALNLPFERTQRAFNAVSQMVSKTVVQQEELRGQLAEAIPGAVQLAAKALDVNTAQLADMVKEGDVLASDLLPKLARLLRQTFGDEAARNSERLSGTIENLRTSVFEFNLALDNSLGISTAWRNILSGLTDFINLLTRNIDVLIGSVGALAGAMLAAFGPQILTGLITLVSWVGRLAAGIFGVGAALAATGIGAIPIILGRIALMAAGATAGFYTFQKAIMASSDASRLLIEDVNRFIETSKSMGGAMRATTSMYIAEIQKRIAAQQLLVDEALKEVQDPSLKKAFLFLWGFEDDPLGTKKLEQAQYRMLELQGKLQELQNIPELKIGDLVDAGDTTELDKAKDRIADMIAEFKKYGDALSAIPNEQAIQHALDLGDALELVKDVPTAELGQLDTMLKANGFSASTTVEAIAYLIESLRNAGDAVDDFQSRLKATPEILQDFNTEMAELQAGIDAMAKGPDAFEQFKKNQEVIQKVMTMREELEKTTLTQDEINRLLADYQEKLNVYDLASDRLERLKSIQEKVAEAFDRGFDRIGETITEAFIKGEEAAISFQNIVEGVLSEIMQMILDIVLLDPLKQIFGDILSSAFSFMGGGGGHPVMGAQGLAIANGKITKMAQGGVLTRPTMFPTRSGMALAREAGEDEAIMPLVRTRGGDLGIKAVGAGGANVTVNIINNTDSRITHQERDDGRGNIQLDVMIDKVVARSIRDGGLTGRAIKDTFGLRPTATPR